MFQPLQQQQQLAQQAQGIRQIPISSSDASMAQSAGTIPMEQSGYVDPRNISVFEAMLAGTEPCNPVFEDDDCACIVDGNPQSPLHFLVFPKDKTNLLRLSTAGILHERLLGHMVLVAKDLAIKYGYEEEGYRLVINDGPAAFQRIPHLAIHVLAGRQLAWPPG